MQHPWPQSEQLFCYEVKQTRAANQLRLESQQTCVKIKKKSKSASSSTSMVHASNTLQPPTVFTPAPYAMTATIPHAIA